jgi:hypothetical protein
VRRMEFRSRFGNDGERFVEIDLTQIPSEFVLTRKLGCFRLRDACSEGPRVKRRERDGMLTGVGLWSVVRKRCLVDWFDLSFFWICPDTQIGKSNYVTPVQKKKLNETRWGWIRRRLMRCWWIDVSCRDRIALLKSSLNLF